MMKPKNFSSKIRIKTRIPTVTFFKTALEILETAIRQTDRWTYITDFQSGKEEVEVSIFDNFDNTYRNFIDNIYRKP